MSYNKSFKTIIKHYYILSFVILFLSCKPNQKEVVNKKNISTPISFLIDSLNYQKEDLRILIDKSDYQLSILSGDVIIKEYPVVFGTNPIDDKLMEGDRRTPEGSFKIRDFYPHKDWSKFIWINYPTEDSWIKHKDAKEKNLIDQKATIGGEIGIHGTPVGREDLIASQSNWTWGCISMTNEDVNDLYQVIYNDMNIEIRK